MDKQLFQEAGEEEGPCSRSSTAPAATSMAELQSSCGDHQSVPPRLHLQRQLRARVDQGCKLARQVEEKLRSTPTGHLAEIHSSELRTSLTLDTLDLVSVFNEASKLLIAGFHVSATSALHPSPLVSQLEQLQSQPQQLTFTTEMPFVSSAPEHAGIGPSSSGRVKKTTVDAAASEQLSTGLNSPPSEMSQGSPRQKDSASAMTFPTTITTATTVRSSSVISTSSTKDANLGKRALQPRITLTLPQSYGDAGGDAPAADGHTWRKYGQKHILGAQHPRNYFRCTHKTTLGCPAIKHVQRCDDDPSTFGVTYKGHHTCRSNDAWPFSHDAFSPSAAGNALLQFSIPVVVSTDLHQGFIQQTAGLSSASGSDASVGLRPILGGFIGQQPQYEHNILPSSLSGAAVLGADMNLEAFLQGKASFTVSSADTMLSPHQPGPSVTETVVSQEMITSEASPSTAFDYLEFMGFDVYGQEPKFHH